jgi:hypothetical protein
MAYPVVSTATVNATTTGLTTSFTKVQALYKIPLNK